MYFFRFCEHYHYFISLGYFKPNYYYYYYCTMYLLPCHGEIKIITRRSFVD